MIFKRSPLLLLGATAAATVLALPACSSSGSETADAAGPVALEVGDYPSADQAAARATFDKRVAAFEKANPDIDVQPVETVWDAQTFQANVAGNTLPDVLKVPFTEIQSLIQRRQVADITDALEEADFADTLNPQTAKVAQDSGGRQFGVPVLPYAIGLFYNRDLFVQAGLDPDTPPTTWEEVREAAKRISQATGVAGYAQMTTENNGGWMLTAQTYSMGGSIEDEQGTKATFDDDATRQALRYLQQMRWEDGSMGSSFLYNMTDIAKDFAAGKVAMFMSVPSASYGAAVSNYGMPRESIGLAPVPRGPGNTGEVLTGGSVEIVSPKTSEEQKAAAVRWIDYFDLRTYSDQETAVAAAKATAEDGGNVGLPRISPVTPELYEQYLGWIAEHINVPQENVAPYDDDLAEVELKTEPVTSAQEVYALLDSVVQRVLTERDADIPSLLSEAQEQAQAKIDRAAR
ncbi:extracellular solute-binding protein [Kineococcus sp. SYSU DK001]|uniref:extracellular solute-binding protein n=1 Tax=Kineococcus sp. SYSU DK001 TaxID=3383122 RepID=UPI003D7C66CC